MCESVGGVPMSLFFATATATVTTNAHACLQHALCGSQERVWGGSQCLFTTTPATATVMAHACSEHMVCEFEKCVWDMS